MAALLHERLADVSFGPRLTGEAAQGLTSEPMMRYGLVVVASPSHHLAKTAAVKWQALSAEDWLVAPSAMDPSSEIGLLLDRLHVPPNGSGCSPTRPRRGPPPARAKGWHRPSPTWSAATSNAACSAAWTWSPPPSSSCGMSARCPSSAARPAVATLLRFLTTPEAMQSMHRSDGGVPASRFRPPVYVTLWS